MIKPFSHLSDVSVETFMNTDWHVRPRLFKQAIPDFKAVCDLDTIFEMASDPDIESRLIQRKKNQWELQQGPFDQLPSLEKSNWTVLIQGINHHLPEAWELLQKFRFIPDARLDDIMLSLASNGGGVGPHYDSYDVFLLQMHGTRRWKIGPLSDFELVEGAPLKLLKNFTPTEEFILEPGDMLYLPPNYGHDGIAEGVCATLSIGFRALNHAEVMATVLQDLAEQIQTNPELQSKLFQDPARGICKKPAEIPDDLIQFSLDLFKHFALEKNNIEMSLGKMLTEPKPIVYYENNTKDLSSTEIKRIFEARGIALSMKTRMLIRDKNVFINGDCICPKNPETLELLAKLANFGHLEPKETVNALVNEETSFFVIGFAKAGWIETLL